MSSSSRLPRVFRYRGMKCECVEINAYSADCTVFLLDIPPNKAVEFAELIPHDLLFRAQVAMLFNLTVTDVNVRVDISETEDDGYFFFYINCKTVLSQNVLKSYINGGLLAYGISRLKYEIGNFSAPFVMKDVTMGDSCFDIYGVTSGVLFHNINMVSTMRFFYSYGANITINIGNEFDIEDETEGHYHTFGHGAILTHELIPAIEKLDRHLSRYLSPNGAVDIKYDHLFVYDQIDEADRYALSFKVIIIPSSFNGIEIEDVSPLSMVVRPKYADDFFENLVNMNMNLVYHAIEEVATSLMSDTNGLYIPEITSHEVCIINGKKWLKVFFAPHLCSFVPDVIHYPMPQEIVQVVVREFTWLFSGEHGIIFSFPTGTVLHDPSVVCYGKADPAIFSNAEYAARFIAAFTSKSLRLRILSRTEGWVFFAIVDRTAIVVSKEDLECVHFDFPFVDDYGVDNVSDVTALRNLYLNFFSCYNFGMALYATDDKSVALLRKRFGDNERKITAILWESSISMIHRPWNLIAEKVRDSIIKEFDEAEREEERRAQSTQPAHMEMDLTSDNPSPKPSKEKTESPLAVKTDMSEWNPTLSLDYHYDTSKTHHDSIVEKIKKFFK